MFDTIEDMAEWYTNFIQSTTAFVSGAVSIDELILFAIASLLWGIIFFEHMEHNR